MPDQRWLHKVLTDDQRGDNDATPKLGEEVLVGVGDLFDQAMGAQTLDQVGGPARGEPVDVPAQILGAEAGDGPLAAGQRQEKLVA